MRWALGILWLSTSALAFDHSAWDKVLKGHVQVNGPISTVDYRSLKGKPDELVTYAKSLSEFPKASFDKLGEKTRLAWLINAYNAFTVKLIVDNHPLKSIKDLGGMFSSPWKKPFFKLFGKDTTLDDIEHGMIRATFKEPRIHFAVVCASKGCPSLRNEAFTDSKLEEQLESGTKSFLKDPTRNRYDGAANRFYLSKIFDWYGSDFGNVREFVAARMATSKEEGEKMKSADVKYTDYDWTLNETPSSVSKK